MPLPTQTDAMSLKLVWQGQPYDELLLRDTPNPIWQAQPFTGIAPTAAAAGDIDSRSAATITTSGFFL